MIFWVRRVAGERPPRPHLTESAGARLVWKTLLLRGRVVNGLLLDGSYRFFGGYQNHFPYHQDRENRHQQQNVSAQRPQVEVLHVELIGRSDAAE